jgi:hypothetical protein
MAVRARLKRERREGGGLRSFAEGARSSEKGRGKDMAWSGRARVKGWRSSGASRWLARDELERDIKELRFRRLAGSAGGEDDEEGAGDDDDDDDDCA